LLCRLRKKLLDHRWLNRGRLAANRWCRRLNELRVGIIVGHDRHRLDKHPSFLVLEPLIMNETPLSIDVLKFQILLKPPESLFLKESLSLGPGLRKLLVLFKFELVDVRVFWQGGQDTQRVILLSC
jgi:hypothetical protein